MCTLKQHLSQNNKGLRQGSVVCNTNNQRALHLDSGGLLDRVSHKTEKGTSFLSTLP